MKTISASDAKNNFGELMDTVQRGPVSIEKHGRPVAVLISQAHFEAMKLEISRSPLSKRKIVAEKGKIKNWDVGELFSDINKVLKNK